MVNKIKRLNPLQIISFILLIISFTLFCFNIKASDKLFWISLSLNMLGYLLFIKMWSREGKTGIKKADKNYDKNLTRKPSDFIIFILIGYYFIVCLIIIINIFDKGSMYEIDNIFSLFVIAFIWNFVLLYIVNRTAKEVSILIGGKKNGNK